MKKVLSIVCIVSLLIGTYAIQQEVSADEEETIEIYKDPTVAGPTLKEGEVITTMDKDGNIEEATDLDESGLVGEPEIQSRSVQATKGVVNFRTKTADENTLYTEDGTGREAETNGHYGTDAAYLEHSADGTKVKFIQAGVVGWVNAKEVEVLEFTNPNIKTISCYSVKNGRIYHHITTNMNSATYANSIDVGPASAAPYLEAGKEYFSYDGHYFYEDYDSSGEGYAKMLSDYRAAIRTNSVNSDNPYYNYFQYLSHRSVSSYSGATLTSYLNGETQASSKLRNTGQHFVDNQNTYGINALLMIGVSVNESGWGMSKIAQEKNNLFGHGANDKNPYWGANGYDSVATGIMYHAYHFLSVGYLDAETDYRYYGSHLGDKASGVNVKYASDPYWGEKAAAVAWKIDTANGNKDAFKYTIGIKDSLSTIHTNSTVRNEASATAKKLYTTSPSTGGGHAPSHYPFLVLGEPVAQNGFYKIQSDTALNADRTAVDPYAKYNFSKDYAYFPTVATTIMIKGSDSSNPGTNPPKISNVVVSDVSSSGYTVTCTIENVTSVKFPTWTSYNGQDDIKWYDGTISGNTASIRINTSNHNNETGEYNTHIYAYASSGEMVSDAIQQVVPSVSGPVDPDPIKINYQTHIQDIGWQDYVSDGEMSGTRAQSKRLEAIRITLDNKDYTGSIQYQTHIQDIGWQNYVSEGEVSGTSSQSKRLEAIRIKLTGELANQYDVYYRVHVQEFGWLGWAKNGEAAGTSSYGYRLEGIEVQLVKKGEKGPSSSTVSYAENIIRYRTHVQEDGWQGYVRENVISGTSAQSKRLEAIQIKIAEEAENLVYTGGLRYQTHIQEDGWQSWVTTDQVSGTSAQSKRLEAIKIELTGELAKHFDIYYRVHAQEFGWLGWAKNGEAAGTSGYSYRLEAIEIALYPKGATPAWTPEAYKSK